MDPESYEPKPIDTSRVELSPELRQKIEELAQNNHEVWSRERLQGGWKYGPERNDARKEHPGLVPYEALSEAEKDVDRKTVEQTLKAAVAIGGKMEIAGPAQNLPYVADERRYTDDMEEWPSLPPGFDGPKEDLLNIYRAADHEAKSRLREHRGAVVLSAVCGTAAVIAAILELYLNRGDFLGVGTEFTFAILALLAVIVGVRAAWMPKWLLERHRAERCRFAKYRALVRLAAAGRDLDALGLCLDDFKEQVKKIERLDEDDLDQFMQEDPIPDDPPAVKQDAQVQASLYELARHYVKQRLASQAKYFFTQSRKKNAVDAPLRLLPPALFFLSIFFALLHFTAAGHDHVVGWIANRKHLKDAQLFLWDKRFWILCAAILPVLGSLFRLLRSAFEYSRNTARFRAKYRALEQLMSKLEVAMEPAQPLHAEEIVRYMWKGELLLEHEHREWLRLMKEAEWFG